MAEDHRRVEARISLTGTGMATDARRITNIEEEEARRERLLRGAPQVGFGSVLERAPARGETDDEPPRRPPERPPEPDPTTSEDVPPAALAAKDVPPPTPPAPRAPLRNAVRAPDPRARQLHALLNATPPRRP
jgi:hypothetical protein